MLRDGYINFDAVEVIRGERKTDMLGRIEDIVSIFGENRFEEILCAHVIEHFYPEDGKKVIRDCYTLLEQDGVLIMEGPDVIGVFELYKENHHVMDSHYKVIRNLYGSNKVGWNELGWHCWGYTRDTMAELMGSLGFEIIHKGIGRTHGMGKRDYRVEGRK